MVMVMVMRIGMRTGAQIEGGGQVDGMDGNTHPPTANSSGRHAYLSTIEPQYSSPTPGNESSLPLVGRLAESSTHRRHYHNEL